MNTSRTNHKTFLLIAWLLLLGSSVSAYQWNTVGGPLGTNWGPQGTTVTYSFMPAGLNTDGGHTTSAIPGTWNAIITAAFNEWSSHCGLTFVQHPDSGLDFDATGATADIRIGRHHFDAALGTLAHGYYPPPNGDSAAGDVHFDEDEDWYVGLGVPGINQIDLFSVALHEIGHAIGLGHSADPTSVMDPTYAPGSTLRDLQPDDIAGIQSHYGESGATPEPATLLLFALCLGALFFMGPGGTRR